MIDVVGEKGQAEKQVIRGRQPDMEERINVQNTITLCSRRWRENGLLIVCSITVDPMYSISECFFHLLFSSILTLELLCKKFRHPMLCNPTPSQAGALRHPNTG